METDHCENFLSRRPRDRIKLGVASLFLVVLTGPTTFALTMIWITEGFQDGTTEFLFMEFSLFALILALFALFWSIFTPRWMDLLLGRMSRKMIVSMFALVVGTMVLILMSK